MSTVITLVVNGEARELPVPVTIPARVLAVTGSEACEGIAIAQNGQVVRRADWPGTVVREGDEFEIVRAVQGG